MVESRIRKGWEVRLDELGIKQGELGNRSAELEGEIGRLDRELSLCRMRKYRSELADRMKRLFTRTFRERDKLVEARFGQMEEWNACSRILRACIIIKDGLDDEEAVSCREVSELKGYLTARLSSEMEGDIKEDILDLLQ